MTDPSAPATPGSRARATGRSRQRSDIQGLRAIAVIAVIAVHVGLTSVTGGFVGVDVFFAISGFLITQQLIRSFERHGRVSLFGFYARRARRILPAATLVLTVTVAYATLLLGFVRTKEIVTDAIWSAFFLANFRFSAQETDYFAADLPPSPLQHFWSLAVEEQFYLVWPVLVLLAVVWHRRRAARLAVGGERSVDPARLRRTLTLLVAALTVLSLLWSAYMTRIDPAGAYFSPFTRAWEIGLGALAALAIRDDGPQDATARWRAQVLGAAGVFLILSACLQFNEATPFPGTPALVPVAGSVFILVAGSLWHGPTVVSRMLSIRPLRALGDWSYSLYLWHFPLLVLPEIHLDRPLSWMEKALLVALAVGLSALSFRYIEEPFRRRGRRLPDWSVVGLYPISVGLVFAVGTAGNAYALHQLQNREYQPAISVAGSETGPDQGADGGGDAQEEPSEQASPSDAPSFTPPPGPSEPLMRASLKAAKDDAGVPTELSPPLQELSDDVAPMGKCDYLQNVRRLCVRGDTNADRTLVLLGDSHARHWIPALEEITTQTGYRSYYLSRPQCTASMVVPDQLGSQTADTECADWRQWAIGQIKKLSPDVLVISTASEHAGVHENGTRYTGDQAASRTAEGYGKLLEAVAGAAERTVFLRDVPTVDSDPTTCLSTNETLGDCLYELTDTSRELSGAQMKSARQHGVETASMDRYFCRRGVCAPVVGSTITYRDDNHITTDYSAWLAGPLGRELKLW